MIAQWYIAQMHQKDCVPPYSTVNAQLGVWPRNYYRSHMLGKIHMITPLFTMVVLKSRCAGPFKMSTLKEEDEEEEMAMTSEDDRTWHHPIRSVHTSFNQIVCSSQKWRDRLESKSKQICFPTSSSMISFLILVKCALQVLRGKGSTVMPGKIVVRLPGACVQG